MARYRFNMGHVLRTLAVFAAVAVTVRLVHSVQMKRHAEGQRRLADDAADAEDEITALGRVLVFDPADAAVRTRHALALAERATDPRKRWRALQVLRQAISARSSPELRLKAARVALSLNEPADAVAYLEPLLALDPNNVEALDLLSRSREVTGNHRAAREAMSKILDVAPDRVDVAKRLANQYRTRLGKPAEADAVLDRIVRKNPKSARAYLGRAEYRIDTDRMDDAASDLDIARSLAPRDADVLAAGAELERRRGRLDEACGYYRQALEIRPEATAFAMSLARIEQECGRSAEATSALRVGLARKPDDPEMLFTLGELLADQGDAAGAEDARKKLPAAARAESLFLSGRIAQARRDPIAAARDYIAALSAGRLSQEVLGRLMLRLAECYGDLEVRDEQLLALQDAVTLRPTPEARTALYARQVALGKGDSVLEGLTALTGQPRCPPEARILLAELQYDRARLFPPAVRRWGEALDALDAAAAAKALPSRVAVIRARILDAQNKPQEAADVLEAAAALDPADFRPWLARYELLTRREMPTVAAAVLAEADSRFGARPDYLLARADQLGRGDDAAAHRGWLDLERRSAKLPPPDRDRLDRRLVSWHARRGNVADVERLAANLARRRPDDVLARLAVVEALVSRGRTEAAEKWLEALKETDGPNGSAWRVGRAAMLVARRTPTAYAEARTLLAEARRLRPGWHVPPALLGTLEDADGRLTQASMAYRAAIDQGENRPPLLRRCLDVLVLLGKLPQAAEAVDLLDRRGDLSAEIRRQAVDVLIRADRPGRAWEVAKSSVRPSRRTHNETLFLGRTLDRLGRTREADDLLRSAVGGSPESVDGWLMLMSHLARQKKAEEARSLIAEMRFALPPARRNLAVARAYEAIGDFRRAVTAYRRLTATTPRDPEPLDRLAALYARLGDPAREADALRRMMSPAVSLQPEELPDVRRRLALAITDPDMPADSLPEAMELLDENLTGRPADDETPSERRTRLLVKGRDEASRESVVRTLVAEPVGLLLPEERLRLARLLEAMNDWPRARTHLLALAEQDPMNPGYVAALASGLVRFGKKVEAGDWVARLEKMEPGTSKTRQLRARLEALEAE